MDLSPERWAEINAVLDEALDRDPDNPAAVLPDICNDPDLREEVRSFLEADEDAVNFLEEMLLSTPVTCFPMISKPGRWKTSLRATSPRR